MDERSRETRFALLEELQNLVESKRLGIPQRQVNLMVLALDKYRNNEQLSQAVIEAVDRLLDEYLPF